MSPPPAKHHTRRADVGTRTRDPLLTMEVLYQLSYVGGAQILAVSEANSALCQLGSSGLEPTHRLTERLARVGVQHTDLIDDRSRASDQPFEIL